MINRPTWGGKREGAGRQEQLEEIYNSLINGQLTQMTEQIDEYGLYDFFGDFEIYLGMHTQYTSKILNDFAKCVIAYHRITS